MKACRSGLTLLEIILALGLLTVAALAIMSVYTIGLKRGVHAERILQATELGREMMETVLETDPGSIPVGPKTFDGRTPTPLVGSFPPAPYPSRDGLDVQLLIDEIQPGLGSVTVQVFYRKGRSVDLQSYFVRE